MPRLDPPNSDPTPPTQDIASLVAAAQASRSADPDTPEGAKAITEAHARLGAAVAARAEEIAGITSDEVVQSWKDRVAGIKADHAVHDEENDRLLEESGVLLTKAERLRAVAERVEQEHGVGDERTVAAREAADEAWKEWEDFSTEVEDPDGCTETGMALEEALRGDDWETQENLDRLSEGYRQALAEVRECGGTLATTKNTDPEARELFQDAAQVYPTQWLEQGNPVRARLDYKRAHYSPGAVRKKTVPAPPETVPAEVWAFRRHEEGNVLLSEDTGPDGGVTVTYQRYVTDERPADMGKPKGRGWEGPFERPGGAVLYRRKATTTVTEVSGPEITSNSGHEGRQTAIHELAHRMEHVNPAIGKVERAFLLARTTREDGTREGLSKIYERGAVEKGRRDSFIDHYVGKEYDDPHFREVFSVGMESTLGKGYGGLLGVGNNAEDRHHRDVTLGILAAC